MATWYAQAGTRNVDAWSGDSSTIWFNAPAGGTAMGGTAGDTWANTVGTARGLQAGDVLCANAQTGIAINTSITCLRISTAAEVDGGDTGNAGGGFTVAAAVTVTANVLSGTTTCITASGTGYTWAVVGNVSCSATTNARGILHTCTGASGILNITNTVITGGGAASSAVYNSASGVINITGDVVGGSSTSSYGFYNGSTGTVNITGNLTGGSATVTFCAMNDSTGTLTVAGGNITGGTGARAVGVHNTSTGTCTVTNCNLINNTTSNAISGQIVYNPADTNYVRYPAPAATTKDYYYDIPDVANVWYNDTAAGVTGTMSGLDVPKSGGTGSTLLAADIATGITLDPTGDNVAGEAAAGGGGGSLINSGLVR